MTCIHFDQAQILTQVVKVDACFDMAKLNGVVSHRKLSFSTCTTCKPVSPSMFTGLLFSQKIVERANKNKCRGTWTVNARGWCGRRENRRFLSFFFSRAPRLFGHLRKKVCGQTSLARTLSLKTLSL